MKKRITTILVTAACVVALSASMLFGCASGANNQAGSEQQQNRTYMSQVNEIMLETNGSLDAFVNAVSSGDIVNIKTTANTAKKALSKLSSLDAPEALQGVQDNYRAGSEKLVDALSQYVDLYANSASGTGVHEVPAEEIAKIQELYDEGVADLKAADEEAASL